MYSKFGISTPENGGKSSHGNTCSPGSSYSLTPESNCTSWNSSKIGSLLTPSIRRTYLTSVVGNQSHNYSCPTLLEETCQHNVLVYGNPLPVLVTEAITSTEKVSDISVRIEKTGWAILVCGRRLFIWKFKQDASIRTSVAHCRELTLPPSDLAHKADLVHVFLTEESLMPSALAVSPEGIVRYWPNIAYEGTSIEATADLQGQECYSLTEVHPLGYILATTTGTLILLIPSISGGQHTVVFRILRVPQGIFAGIGRKVSSFIFGSMPMQEIESKQLTRVLSTECESNKSPVLYSLSFSTLQKWGLSGAETDLLLFEHDIERCLKEKLFHALWTGSSPTQLHQLRIWCVDMQLTQNGIAILAAATNLIGSKIVNYALAVLDDSTTFSQLNISSFGVVKHSEKYQDDNEEWLWKFKLILPSKDSQFAYMYSSCEIYCFSVTEPGGDCDLIDASSWGAILGAGKHENLPLLFTKLHGLLALQPAPNLFVDVTADITPEQETLIEKSVCDTTTDDELHTRLRVLMCMFYNNEKEKCQKSVSELFFDSPISANLSSLDSAVITLSQQIIDDYPVSDPRWCESIPAGDAVSSSLIILHQLEDKMKVHQYLIKFLQAVGLYEKLSKYKMGETTVSTKALLCEHGERLIAAKTLRRMFLDHEELLNEALKGCLENRELELKNSLTHQDMFFREVSSIHTIFKAIYDVQEQLCLDNTSENPLKIIITVNEIFLRVINDALDYRKLKDEFYGLMSFASSKLHYQPWTNSEAPDGLRTVMSKQVSFTAQNLSKAAESMEILHGFTDQLGDIIKILLQGYTCEMESVQGTNLFTEIEAKYIAERNRLLKLLVENKRCEKASSLAEKYLDFDILMEICEASQDEYLLQRYIMQFKHQGFLKFMFKWYMEKGMKDRILAHSHDLQEDLSEFLKDHGELSWLHYISNNQYDKAHHAIKDIAFKEKDYCFRQKTLLSLSKLCALASNLPVNEKAKCIDDVDCQLDFILHQERLPDPVVLGYGLDPDTMRVFSPEELIEMYISDENTLANCYDFKIALEMLVFLNKLPGDEEYEKLRQRIWCKAILHDNWEELDTSNPLEAARHTTFFEVIELAFQQGTDLHDFIIPVEDLLKLPDLSTVAENPNFSFLIRAGYEHILKTIE